MFILVIAVASVVILAVMERRQADQKIARRQTIKRQTKERIRRELMPPMKRSARWVQKRMPTRWNRYGTENKGQCS